MNDREPAHLRHRHRPSNRTTRRTRVGTLPSVDGAGTPEASGAAPPTANAGLFNVQKSQRRKSTGVRRAPGER